MRCVRCLISTICRLLSCPVLLHVEHVAAHPAILARARALQNVDQRFGDAVSPGPSAPGQVGVWLRCKRQCFDGTRSRKHYALYDRLQQGKEGRGDVSIHTPLPAWDSTLRRRAADVSVVPAESIEGLLCDMTRACRPQERTSRSCSVHELDSPDLWTFFNVSLLVYFYRPTANILLSSLLMVWRNSGSGGGPKVSTTGHRPGGWQWSCEAH